MSLLVRVIKFKHLTKQLSKTEFDQFVSKLISLYDREIILQLLCSQFIKNASFNANEEILDKMLNITEKIIQSRKSKDIEKPNITKIDQLPSPLIGEISSYLYQNEYSSFSRTNQAIFVSCNTPNTLRKMDLSTVTNYASIKLPHYPRINYLRINIGQFTEFPVHQQSVLPELATIELFANGSCNNDMAQFSHQNYLNVTNLTAVQLTGFLDAQFVTFCQILSHFRMIQHLYLFGVTVFNIIPHEIGQLLPNLTRLSLFFVNPSIANTILTEYGSNLECLSLGDIGLMSYAPFNFNKLRRLLVIRPSINTIQQIFKTTNVLREMVFVPHENQIAATIKKIVSYQSLLEFFYVATTPINFEVICDSIGSALYKTNKRKRENFEIVLEIDCRQKINASDFMFSITKIVNALNASNTNNFMVDVECHGDNHVFDLEPMLNAINNYIRFIPTIKLIKATSLGFIIGNKECKMQRHHQWWNECGGFNF